MTLVADFASWCLREWDAGRACGRQTGLIDGLRTVGKQDLHRPHGSNPR
ncbi:hypothetical protein [Streptomyces sp. NBC_00286]|nr:hypothetical protein [Streptomyces sp. NBC_00286]